MYRSPRRVAVEEPVPVAPLAVKGTDRTPAWLRVQFAERACELTEDPEAYSGWISKGWIQQEQVHIDVLPAELSLPRRYAFRYVRLEVLDVSGKYSLVLSDAWCDATTSADDSALAPYDSGDGQLKRLDAIACRTLRGCMQTVFEDGPKRDRRLWMGDLRLQALTNYATFRNNDLVKRCLYLFAGLTLNEGRVGACLFTEPLPRVDDTALFDFSLFFPCALWDYFEATSDRDTLTELAPTAYKQLELSLKDVDGRGLVADREGWWCFLDWGDGLNKQAGAHAVLIYALRRGVSIVRALGDEVRAAAYEGHVAALTRAALEHLWDEKLGFFVSGAERQVSWASQVWFVLAEVFDRAENAALLRCLMKQNPGVPMVTPYMYHHFIDALLRSGMEAEALAAMKSYWGGMLRDGADTFWELYDPKDRYASPYGSRLVNSFCHAWSGTPAYFIRTHFVK